MTMQSKLGHMQINVDAANLPFYKGLFTFLGWQTIYENADMYSAHDTNGTSLWFIAAANGTKNDYDGAGVNHLGIGVAEQSDVDKATTYLQEQNVELLFETPRHRPDFSQGADQTYYQVMFESPDRILWEIVYTGPKA